MSARAVVREKYRDVAVAAIEHEDRLPPEDAGPYWEAIFRLFGANNEDSRNEVKVVVYAYFAINGTSQKGKLSRDLVANGTDVPANDVALCVRHGTLREFLRSDVVDAYYALKTSEVLERDEIFVAKVAQKGVPRGYAHCAVDFLRGCPEFTPEEAVFADKAFKVSIERASVARGGKSIEELDSANNMERVRAGAPSRDEEF